MFSVRTPTATVTDLGTEFGVEVKEDGDVTAHVFEGAVELKAPGNTRCKEQVFHVAAGESVRLKKGAEGKGPTAIRALADETVFAARPGRFAELVKEENLKSFRRWRAFSSELRKRPDLLAYYDFQQDRDERSTLRNRAATGRRLDGRIKGAVWGAGRFPGKQALYFHGKNCGNRVELPEQERFQFSGPFSVAVWFKVERFEGQWVALAAKGDRSWRLQQDEYANAISFGVSLDIGPDNRQTTTAAGRSDVADGRWRLAVAVYEPGDEARRARLYLDGRLETESRLPPSTTLHQNDEPVWLGDNSVRLDPSREFQGYIDEAAFFTAALSAEEVAEMFQAGAPDRPSADGERR